MFVGYDTGHDNSARLDVLKYKGNYEKNGAKMNASVLPDCEISPVIAVDLNCNLYQTLKTISKIATILNDHEGTFKYNEMANEIKAKIFKYCYDKDDAFFYDVDKFLNKRKCLSSTIFHLFLENVLAKEKDKKLINEIYTKHIKNEKEFFTNYPFPSVAISDDNWLNHKMPNSWGYYSQALIALRCSLWMDEYGFSNDYDYILKQWVNGLIKNYDKYPMSQELDPITGDSSGASLWYSSSMLLFLYAVNRLKLI